MALDNSHSYIYTYIYIYIRIYICDIFIHTCIALHCLTRHGLTPLVLVASIGFHTQVTLRFPCNFLSRRQRLRITDGFHYQFESLEEAYSRTCIKSETFETGIACSKSSADIWPTQQNKSITSGRADRPLLRDRDQCGRTKRRQSFKAFAAFTAAAIARAEGTAWGTPRWLQNRWWTGGRFLLKHVDRLSLVVL